jgi:hypothetical protein
VVWPGQNANRTYHRVGRQAAATDQSCAPTRRRPAWGPLEPLPQRVEMSSEAGITRRGET